jgi:biotin carboxyl carrier protein
VFGLLAIGFGVVVVQRARAAAAAAAAAAAKVQPLKAAPAEEAKEEGDERRFAAAKVSAPIVGTTRRRPGRALFALGKMGGEAAI